MRIFVLEDDPIRIVQLCRFFDAAARSMQAPHYKGTSTAVQVDWACSCVQEDRFKGPYDLILLDHDLGGRQMDPFTSDNGRAFLRLIKEDIHDALVIIHSHNDVAAKSMKANDWPAAVLAEFGDVKFWTLLTAVVK